MAGLVRTLTRFTALTEAEQRAIQDLSVRPRVVAAGADLVRAGDAPAQCCLVVDGWLCRYRLLSGGRRQILGLYLPGDVPDLQNLHLPVREDGLAALTKATVILIPHDKLRALTAAFPNLATALWCSTLVDAGIQRAWLVGLGRRSAHERVGHLICELYLRLAAIGLAADHRCQFPLTQTCLADTLGVTSVHINRTFKAMRKQELLTLRRNVLTIHAWDALVYASGFDPGYLHLAR
ncbi:MULTISPECIES: Crp/Fnr family transcriptional regulator [Methylobacteriaceae]|uniref:Fumarate and nitrate reduction regulatory protein n=2 Tax=Methylobacteriaceae TaxID=119045 RepID=A0AA37HSX6_9HYPH|nr:MULTISPECIES: Crp/Fnr family transcriptional regulator [Methylobacteriaceae]MDQ0520098.1 CRP-like cAMP-binding protein [Methylobacterium gregans]BAU90611.1 transcriptional regulator, Crp/Fnr family [Methylorubrum populi]GJD81250.1 Fumarate and nitrate reduction regulatory protein [Methylobacterium gregans]GLS52502.1 Crp/Fnr family transcriptional regulator [Methylobacterium gregans]